VDLKEFGSKIASIAPMLGGAFLGPAGAAGGALLKVIAGAFGLKDDAKPDEIYQAIQADPEAMIKLKELELKHTEVIARLNQEWRIKQLESDLENVRSARGREVDVTKATGKKENSLYVLAWLVVIGFFVSFAVVICFDMPTSEVAKTSISILLGALIASYRDVMNYFFGSSKGSADKTKLLAGDR